MNYRPYQQDEITAFGNIPKRAIFWEPRTGKSFAGIGSMEAGVPQLKRGVVTAPYGVCPWWKRLLTQAGYTVLPLYELPVNQALEALAPSRHDSARRTIAVTNYQRLSMVAARRPRPRAGDFEQITLAQLLGAWGPDAFMIDESHYITSPSALRARSVRQLAWQAPWVRCLSGTPAPNTWGDLWGQLSALDPATWGYFFTPFADRWLLRDAVYHRVYGYRDPELFQQMVNRYCSFKRREDVYGPDDWRVGVREIELPRTAARLYARMAKEWLIDDPDLHVDGSHILTRLLRLQQLASGCIADDDERVLRQVHTAKLDAVETDLGEIMASGLKAVVFHRFVWEGQMLHARLASKYRTLVINGATPAAQREAVVQAVEQAEGPLVAIVQTQSGGIGISFAEATYALMMSESFSFTDARQARDRIFKEGVPRHVMHYRALDTVDYLIAERLANKESGHDTLLQFDRADMAFGRVKIQRKRSIEDAPLWEAS